MHNRRKALSRLNCKLALQKWGLTRRHPLLDSLRKLSEEFELSVLTGDLMLLQTHWYVTHTGLLRLARRNRCSGMRVQFIRELSDPSACRFAFEATVFTTKTCTGFVGYGDADPSNVSPLVHGAEMRVAETRAVNRALRKAYGIGICSVEEIGSFAEAVPSSGVEEAPTPAGQWKERKLRWPQGPRPPLPADPPAPTRCQPRQVLRRRFLRHQDPPRSLPRAGRSLRRPPGRLGRERPQCPALPAEQLSRQQGRCGMRRYFESLRPADVSAIHSVPDGIFLVRVDRAQYRWHKQKPYYEIRFAVFKPKHLTGCFMTGRLYCTPRAMWKLSWFLRDFGYDAELLGKNEIDDKALIDLWGVVKVSEVTVHGISVLNFDGFAPAARWEELSVFTDSDPRGSEVSS